MTNRSSIVETTDPSALAPGAVAPLSAEAWALTRPDLHLAVLDADGALAARCSLWWTHTPPVEGERVGLVGHFAAGTDAASTEAATALLRRAEAILAERGGTHALGPMDGSTWHPYRLVSDRHPDTAIPEEPPFVMEPDTPAAWLVPFERAGWAPVQTYHSSVIETLSDDELPLPEGFTLRPFRPEAAEADLAAIYSISVEAFPANPFYTSLPEAVFLATYRAMLPHAVPSLIWFAEHDGAPVAFAFALPELLRARRGAAMDTVVHKTLAVRPAWEGRGLAGALTARVHAEARRLGFTRAIHALMHDANRSTRLGGAAARPIRRYALFGKTLGAGR